MPHTVPVPNSATAIVFTAPGCIELRHAQLQPLAARQYRVRTLYSMTSPGTELRVLAGHYGAAGKFPLVPGYSSVGRIEELGADVVGYRVGDLVSCRNPAVPLVGLSMMWGGQASQHVCASIGEDRPVLLPDGADPLDFVTAEISAISLRGVTAAAPRPGETAVVVGQGLIGASSAMWLSAAGCRVIVCDTEAGRLKRARAWSSQSVRIGDGDHVARLNTLLEGGADIVVEASGTTPGFALARTLLRRKPQAYGIDYKVEPIQFYHQDWPRLVLQANYLDEVPVNPFNMVAGEGMILLAPKDRGVEDRQAAIESLRRRLVPAASLVQRVLPAAQAPAAYLGLRDDRAANFSLVLDWAGV